MTFTAAAWCNLMMQLVYFFSPSLHAGLFNCTCCHFSLLCVGVLDEEGGDTDSRTSSCCFLVLTRLLKQLVLVDL